MRVVVLLKGIVPSERFGFTGEFRTIQEAIAARGQRGETKILFESTAEDAATHRSDEFLGILTEFGAELKHARLLNSRAYSQQPGREHRMVLHQTLVLEFTDDERPVFRPNFKPNEAHPLEALEKRWERWVQRQFAKSWTDVHIIEQGDTIIVDLCGPKPLNLGDRVAPLYAEIERTKSTVA